MLMLLEAMLAEFGTDFAETWMAMLADNSGATAIEYGLIAALVAIAAVGAMSGLGSQLSKTFNNASTVMSNG